MSCFSSSFGASLSIRYGHDALRLNSPFPFEQLIRSLHERYSFVLPTITNRAKRLYSKENPCELLRCSLHAHDQFHLGTLHTIQSPIFTSTLTSIQLFSRGAVEIPHQLRNQGQLVWCEYCNSANFTRTNHMHSIRLMQYKSFDSKIVL